MPDITLRDYLDVAAIVDKEEDEEEDEELDDEDLDHFLNDDDEDTTSERAISWHTSPTPTDFTNEASEIRSRFIMRRTGASVSHDHDHEILRQHLVPRVFDPHMWLVRVKPGYESDLVLQVAQRTTLGDKGLSVDISSAFARAGIPGFIFLEGELSEVVAAVQDLVTVFHYVAPRLVPLEQRAGLLSPHNPLSDPMEVGQWVRCLYGLYRNDIGFVCGHRPYYDAETSVALLPRIPEKPEKTAKRKKISRPVPRTWSLQQLEAVWGKSQVRRLKGGEYVFRRENYLSGLIIMQVPSASVGKVDSAPNSLRPFLDAPFIRDMPSFAPWIHRFAQDSIKPGQWVKVESGDHQGALGKPLEIVHSVASLMLTSTGDGPTLQIPLRTLTPFYRDGDNVKCRWSGSCGLVTSVDEVQKTLTYVEKDSEITNVVPMDAVEHYDPTLSFFRLTTGTWVEFIVQTEADQKKQRGYVKYLEGRHAFVNDEHTLAEFKIETRVLEVSSIQAPSLPKNTPVHPLTGKRVVVTHGPFKGLYGDVREVGATAITVELGALLIGASSPIQTLKWHELMIMPKDVEIARSNHPLQRRTPSPDPELNPRDSTPDPTGHWVFSVKVQHVIERKCIPFYIRGTGDTSMEAYYGKPARTVPITKRTLTPREGEICVRTVKRTRPEQISINPRYLVPWKPLVGCEVVITCGFWSGFVGAVKGQQGVNWVVTITVDNDAHDTVFAERELAALEPLK